MARAQTVVAHVLKAMIFRFETVYIFNIPETGCTAPDVAVGA